MSLKYPLARGGFVKFHPPPNKNQGTFNYIGNSGISISRLKAFTFKHPPPSIIYERRKLHRQKTETSPSEYGT